MDIFGTFKVGVFDTEEKMISSIKSLQQKGVDIFEVYTPYPIHEVLHLLKRKSRLPTAAYIYGLTGAFAVIAFLYYTSVISWPIVYGGKPFNSFPSFIVITIILTILTVTISSLATFSARSKLYPGQNNPIFHERATDDMFVIVVKSDTKVSKNAIEAEKIFLAEGAVEVTNKELVKETN
jgi:Alternative complex III, ActD subunit